MFNINNLHTVIWFQLFPVVKRFEITNDKKNHILTIVGSSNYS